MIMNKFLQRLNTTSHIEINTLTKIYKSVADVPRFEEQNIFFCCWLKEELDARCNDSNIWEKNYFVLDLDIRNNSKEEISDEEIKACADILEEALEKTPFSDWSYIIYSGNWLHLYYIWNPILVSPEVYSDWVGYIYKEFERILDNPLFTPDYACRNISRIMRIPTSVNQKNWAKVEILKEREVVSGLVSYIPAFAQKEAEIKKAEMEERQKRALDVRKRVESSGKSSIWDDIDSIPAWKISEWLKPEFKYSWNRNFHSDNPKRNKWTAFYYSESRNCIINGGSSHYNWRDSNSWWWPFDLVKREKGWSDRETFEFFKKLIN